MNNLKSKDKKVEEILPLLSAKQAKALADKGTAEQELQVVADLIRSRVESNKYTLEVLELNYAGYVYDKLIEEDYIVVFSTVNSLKIRWDWE